MRVTQSMLSNNMLRNLSKSYTSMNKYMDQLTTGKKINRPSDDPVIAMKGMRYRTEVSNVEQFQRNITEMHTWMDTSDETLDETTQILNKLRDLTVQSANETYDAEQRKAIKKEVDQLKLQLVEVGNTKVNNKYIFNGTQTTMKPIKVNGSGFNPSYEINPSSPVMLEVTAGTKLQANVTPENVFNKELFKTVSDLSTALEDDNTAALDSLIGEIDGHINNTIGERADLGARMNRVELIESRLEGQSISARNMMSRNEDVDTAEVIIKLTSQEAIHRAALSAGSRVIQPTLLDFLR